MPSRKTHDLAVKTGSYTVNGEEKGRWQNIGSVFEGENGRYILLNRTFNPAGVPNPENRDTVMVSMFEPKERDGESKPATAPKRSVMADLESDVPF